VLDHLVAAGRTVLGIGKIQTSSRTKVTDATYSDSNEDGVDRTIAALRDGDLVFTNLVDFDSVRPPQRPGWVPRVSARPTPARTARRGRR
jgi:phosphopentomutase